MSDSRRVVGGTLFLCLAASQAAVLTLTPVLAPVASDLGVSTAAAGQLRTVSGLAAGTTALLAGLLASRLGLRDLLAVGLALLVLGSAVSAAAPDFATLAFAQIVVGVGVGLTYSAAVAAVADWSLQADRSRVLALALLGPPAAWIVGMPICGLVGDVSWRLTWVAVPLALAAAALVVLARRPSTPPAALRADLGALLRDPDVARWSSGELLAYSAWAGSLVFMGAFFVETHGLSVSATGLVLGAAAAAYVPGNVLFRRFVDEHDRILLVALALAAAATVAILGAVRVSVWFSFACFALLSFLAGGRTLAGSARGLDLAPELRLGVTGIRTAALQLGYFVGAAVGGVALSAGGYGALGIVLAALFVGAAVPHVPPLRSEAPSAPLP